MAVTRHFTRCMLAGAVALIPVAGIALTVVYVEFTLTEGWLAAQSFYFPGLGLLLAVAIVYAVGLFVTTFLGRWLWRVFDSLLDSLPALGALYQSLKQILGYGKGKDALYERVVLLPGDGGFELGLVTNRTQPTDDGVTEPQVLVFVPGSPNPTSGRLVFAQEAGLIEIDMEVADAFKSLVTMGKLEVPTVATS